jgi:hypothetical protein
MGGGGQMKKVKKVNMIDALSIQVWIWDIQTCWNHHRRGTKVERRIMEGINQFWVLYIYGNVTMKPPVNHHKQTIF